MNRVLKADWDLSRQRGLEVGKTKQLSHRGDSKADNRVDNERNRLPDLYNKRGYLP